VRTFIYAFNGDPEHDKPCPKNYGHALEFVRKPNNANGVYARCIECKCHGPAKGSRLDALTEFRRECGKLGHWCKHYKGETK